MRTSLALTLLAAALALPAVAAAKGPSQATVSGPGIDGTKAIAGDGEGGPGTPLGSLVAGGGFFPQVFGGEPDRTTDARPAGDLGPRFTVTYVVPGPDGDSSLRQDVYPYARPDPVTYMAPGQEFWDGQRALGGWYVATEPLVPALGLPAEPPGGSGTHVWRWIGAASAALVLLLAAAGLAVGWLPWGSRSTSTIRTPSM